MPQSYWWSMEITNALNEVHQLIQNIQQHFSSEFLKENWICLVFRHFINEHSAYPQAQKAAEVAEAAAAQGQFWQMHDMLFTYQEALGNGYLVEYANHLGLDISQFLQDLSKPVHVDRINQETENSETTVLLLEAGNPDTMPEIHIPAECLQRSQTNFSSQSLSTGAIS